MVEVNNLVLSTDKMKFNVAAAAASAALMAGGVSADEQKVLKDEPSSIAEAAAPELPTFTVSVASRFRATLLRLSRPA